VAHRPIKVGSVVLPDTAPSKDNLFTRQDQRGSSKRHAGPPCRIWWPLFDVFKSTTTDTAPS